MEFPGHFEQIFQQLNHQRLHAQLCDCVVLVGNQRFQSHRSILAGCSSHFRALLSSTEVDEGGAPGTDGTAVGVPSVINLDPGVVTPEAFSTLLDMIYTSTLTVGTSNVMDVLLAASHLHLNTVVKACKLYLSRCNFPTSPPKSWRSAVKQQPQPSPPSQAAVGVSNSAQQGPVLLQHVGVSLGAFDPDVELHERQAGMEVSQSGGDENGGVGLGGLSGEQRQKRKSPLHEERCGSRPKTCRLSPQSYGDGSSITTWTISNNTIGGGGEGEELPSPDSLKTDEGLLLGSTAAVGEEEVEEKYEATKGESEEKQLPSQSDSSVAATQRDGGVDGDAVVKVKVGEEEEEKLVEVKMENLSSSSSPDLVPVPDVAAHAAEFCNDQLDEFGCCEKLSPQPTEGGSSPSEPQPCAVPQTETQTDDRDAGEESIDSESLVSLSDLALSCFLNTGSESVMGTHDNDSLALTTTATMSNSITSAAQTVLDNSGESPPNAEATNACSPPTSCSASSLVFPVTSVPFQQLLPTQAHSFSDTLILQPSQTSLGGILRPGLSLQAPLIQPSAAGKGRELGGLGAPGFRRIAPKVIPGSEGFIDPQSPSSSSGCAGEAVNHSALTRASEDVLSKCKKAASSDHVLLVEGEKKYACRICCKTFMNLTDCKKHIRVHTGEKPYPCPKCGKRFSQSSHLYKHCNNTCLNWKSGTQLIPSSSDTL